MSLDGTVKIGVDLDDKNFKSALSRLGETSKNALSVAGTAIAGVGTALVGLGVASVGMASQFESSMAMTSTLFGDVNVNADLLSTNMLALSSATGYTAKELGDSLYNALSAGIPVTEDMGQALEFMEKSSKLAIGAGADLGAVVDSQTSIMNAYKMETKDLDKVQKILIQTQNKGKTTVAELSQSLSNVTPVAAAMGVEFDQVGASLATMTAQGTPTAVATTQLKSLFAELGKSGTQANKGLAEATKGTIYAGKSFQRLAEDGVPLNTILDLMKDYAEKNGKSLLDMFGSIEAGNAALSLSGENSETYADNLEAMSTSADVVGSAFETMSNTFAYQSKRAKESFKNLGIAMVQEQDGMLASLGQFANDIVGSLQTAFDEGGTQGLVGAVGGVFSKILIAIAENTPSVVQASVDVIQSFIKGIGENTDKVVQASLEIGTSIITGISKVIPDAINLALKITNEFIKNLFGVNLSNKFTQLIKEFQKTFKSIETIVKKSIEIAIKYLGEFVKIITNIANVVLPIINKALEFFAKNLEKIAPIVLGIVAAFKTHAALKSVTQIINGVSKSYNTVVTALKEYSIALELSSAMAARGISVELLLTSALKTKEIVWGVLTGKIGLATAAQALWNKVCAMNPIAMVAIAVGALTVGIGALILSQEQEVTATQLIIDKNNELIIKNQELTQSVKDNMEARNNSTDGIMISSEVNKGLIDTLYKLEQQEHKTAEEIGQMQSIVDILNREIPNLNLSIDAGTGFLSLQKDAVLELNDAYVTKLELQIREEELVQILRDRMAVDKQLEELEKSIVEIEKLRNEKQAELEDGTRRHGAETARLQREYNKYTKELDLAKTSEDELRESKAKLNEEQEKNIKKSGELQVSVKESTKTTQDATKANKESSEQTEKSNQKVSDSSDKTTKNITENNQEVGESYQDTTEIVESENEKIVESSEKTSDESVQALSEMPKEAKKIGEQTSQNLADGIKSKANGAISSARNMANGIMNELNKIPKTKTGYFGNSRSVDFEEQSSIQSRMATENRKTNASLNLRSGISNQTQVTNAPNVSFKNTFNVSNNMDIAYVSQELGRQTSQAMRNTGVVMI